MLFKLKIKHDTTFDMYEPTSIFHVDEFIDYGESKNILLLAKNYINSNPIKDLLVNGNEIHFEIDKTENGYNILPTKKSQFSIENIENIICGIVGMTKKELFEKTRADKVVIPRSVVYTALRYFCGISYSEIAYMYRFDHSTILHACKVTLPSLLYSKDMIATKLVVALAEEYTDNKFLDYCKSFDEHITKKKKSKFKFLRYSNIYKRKNKHSVTWRAQVGNNYDTIVIGTYPTRPEAEMALNAYIKTNNIKRRIEEIRV